MKTITKRYAKDDVRVVWQPHLSIHSGICFSGLPAVFNPRIRPWIMPAGASRDAIIAQVAKCPSGALSIEAVEPPVPVVASVVAESDAAEVTRIEAQTDGPLLVHGTLLVRGGDDKCKVEEGTTVLCRSGDSANKPYCDGTHARIGFKG